MNVYQAFFSLRQGTDDMQFAADLAAFLDHMKQQGRLERWRLLRRKLGLGPKKFGEFQLLIETHDLAQLDDAFNLAARRAGETETKHFAVNSKIDRITFGLYRDFPDSVRRTGEELF